MKYHITALVLTLFITLACVPLLLRQGLTKHVQTTKGIYAIASSEDLNGANERTTQYLQVDSQTRYNLQFNKDLQIPRPNTPVVVTGTVRDNTIQVTSIKIDYTQKVFEADKSHASTTARMAVIRFNFPDKLIDPAPVPTITYTLFTSPTSTSAFYNKTSNGQYLIAPLGSTGSVISSLVTISANSATGNCSDDAGLGMYRYEKWGQEALSKTGINAASYNLVLYVFPKVSSCTFGEAMSGTGIYANGEFGAGTTAHEIGHVLGLGHANLCSNQPGGYCQSYSEYEDQTDTMGKYLRAIPSHFVSGIKEVLGWMPTTRITSLPLTSLSTNGAQYQLYAIEGNTGTQEIVLPKTDTGEGYYLTYRNLSDTFDNQTGIQKAVYVHIVTSKRQSTMGTYLPSTYLVTTLLSGQVFSDTANGIEVTNSSMGTDVATLNIKRVGSQTILTSSIPNPLATPTSLPIIPIGGYIWDTNLNPVANKVVQVEGMGAAGYIKSYSPVTSANGFYKQDWFIVKEGSYNARPDGTVVSLTDTNSRNYGSQTDQQGGSIAYLNQKAGFWDCATIYGDQTFRCNFLSKVAVNTTLPVYDVTAYSYLPSTSTTVWKYKYVRTYLANDGKTTYTRKCDFHTLIGYPTNCSAYTIATLALPSLVRGYSNFSYTGGGTYHLRESYLSTDGWTSYTRTCVLDKTTGALSSCSAFVTTKITTPTAARDINEIFLTNQVYQSYISSDGTKSYARICSFDTTTTAVSACTAFNSYNSSAQFNGVSNLIWKDGYGRQRLQQFIVGADGRTPYFRNCSLTSLSAITCPAFY